jgi:hypothetical protein
VSPRSIDSKAFLTGIGAEVLCAALLLSGCSANGSPGAADTANLPSNGTAAGAAPLSCDSPAVKASASSKLVDWIGQNMALMIRDQRAELGGDHPVSVDMLNGVRAQLVVEISSSVLAGTRDGIPVCDATAYVGFRDAGGVEDQTGSGALPVEFLLSNGQASFDVGPFPASFIAKGGFAPLSPLPRSLSDEIDHQHQLRQSAQP